MSLQIGHLLIVFDILHDSHVTKCTHGKYIIFTELVKHIQQL